MHTGLSEKSEDCLIKHAYVACGYRTHACTAKHAQQICYNYVSLNIIAI